MWHVPVLGLNVDEGAAWIAERCPVLIVVDHLGPERGGVGGDHVVKLIWSAVDANATELWLDCFSIELAQR
jgi:hypothetical protein